jgi:hypothetical protein
MQEGSRNSFAGQKAPRRGDRKRLLHKDFRPCRGSPLCNILSGGLRPRLLDLAPPGPGLMRNSRSFATKTSQTPAISPSSSAVRSEFRLFSCRLLKLTRCRAATVREQKGICSAGYIRVLSLRTIVVLFS